MIVVVPFSLLADVRELYHTLQRCGRIHVHLRVAHAHGGRLHPQRNVHEIRQMLRGTQLLQSRDHWRCIHVSERACQNVRPLSLIKSSLYVVFAIQELETMPEKSSTWPSTCSTRS